jgi:magnesium chelatase subunit I
MENLVSSTERRGILTGEDRVIPRMCDLAHLVASCRGKVELMLAEDGQGAEDALIVSLIGEAVKGVFEDLADVDEYELIIEQFTEGLTLTAGDDVSADEYIANMKLVDGLYEAATDMARRLDLDIKDDQAVASAGEFLLEALYVSNRLSKFASAAGTGYRR